MGLAQTMMSKKVRPRRSSRAVEAGVYKDLFSVAKRDMDMVRGAIDPAVPGTSDDAHPALKVSFGKMQCQLPSEQERQAFKCAVANTLDYYNCYRTACGALCAQCRRVLSLDTQRVFACRVCVSAVLHHGICARAHNEEHRPVCIKHENWADDAPQAKGAVARVTVVDLSGGSGEVAPQDDDAAAERAKQEIAALAKKEAAVALLATREAEAWCWPPQV